MNDEMFLRRYQDVGWDIGRKFPICVNPSEKKKANDEYDVGIARIEFIICK